MTAPDLSPQEKPDDWFNRICEALGLFDGARPVSVKRVMWDEVLPAIEALKTNNPEAAIFIDELKRKESLWRDALKRLCDIRQGVGWHDPEDGFYYYPRELPDLLTVKAEKLAAADTQRAEARQQIASLVHAFKALKQREIETYGPIVVEMTGRCGREQNELRAALEALVQGQPEALKPVACSGNIHGWPNESGDYGWRPDVGAYCDCGQKQWPFPEPAPPEGR